MHLTRSWNPILCYSLMTVAELLQFRPQSFYNATGTHERKIKTKHLRVSFPYISRFGSKRSLYNFSLIFAKHWFRLSFSLFHFFKCARCIVCVFVFFLLHSLVINCRRITEGYKIVATEPSELSRRTKWKAARRRQCREKRERKLRQRTVETRMLTNQHNKTEWDVCASLSAMHK